MDWTYWWGLFLPWFGILPLLLVILLFVFAARMCRWVGQGRWCSRGCPAWDRFAGRRSGRAPHARGPRFNSKLLTGDTRMGRSRNISMSRWAVRSTRAHCDQSGRQERR